MPNKKSRYVHRYFCRLLRIEGQRFCNHPVIINSEYDKTEFIFNGIHSAVQGTFQKSIKNIEFYEIAVSILWENKPIELLYSREIKCTICNDGSCCSHCLPENCVNNVNKIDAFLKSEIDILIEWCNKNIAPSNWIELQLKADTIITAKLIIDKPAHESSGNSLVHLRTGCDSALRTNKIIVIPDIHGCNATFKQLLFNLVKIQVTDTIYLLGDYIDRGSDSKGVIDTILELQRCGYDVRPIRGNHEDMLLKALNSHSVDDISAWLDNGGRNTLQSYGVDHPADIPAEHIKFMKDLPCILSTDEYVFVHAALDFNKSDPLTESDEAFMLWERCKLDIQVKGICGRKVYVGHTIRDLDMILDNLDNNIVQLDNGCFAGNVNKRMGNLLALELHTGELYIQEFIG